MDITPLTLLPTDEVSVIEPGFLNESRSRLNEVLTTLGDGIEGSEATLAARLATMAGGSGGIPPHVLPVGGIAPTSLTTGGQWTKMKTWAGIVLTGTGLLAVFQGLESTLINTENVFWDLKFTASGVEPALTEAVNLTNTSPKMCGFVQSRYQHGSQVFTPGAGTYDVHLLMTAYETGYNGQRASVVKGICLVNVWEY